MSFSRVAVVGVGLIGGSVALRLRERGIDVVVLDPDPKARAAALAAGLRGAAPEDLADRDLVVLAGPLPTLGAALTAVGEAAPDAVLIDVGSVKEPVREDAREAGVADRYVGCHPMAGRESSGFAHASDDLLVDVSWAVVRPEPVAIGHAVDVVRFLLEVFEATVVVLDAAEHDRAVALVSHAPHVLAHALLEATEHADGPARWLAAGSFRDATRVAGTHPTRTLAMLADNAPALRGVLDDLIALLGDYRAELDARGELAARLEDVAAGAGGVREPEARWTSCGDLAGVLARGPATVLRAGPLGPESAPA